MKLFKKIGGAIIIGVGIILFSTLWSFQNQSAFEIVTIFLSITTGFTITALSIIATSKFSKQLYLIEDANDNSRTLLHNLVRKIQSASLIFVVVISLILLHEFFPQAPPWSAFNIRGYDVDLKVLLHATVWVMVILAFYKFVAIFNIFADFVIQAAKRQ